MPFAPKVRNARFNYSGLTSQQMLTLSEFAAVDIRRRIQQGQTVDDQAAAPLTPKYQRYKQRRTGSGLRDMTLTGITMRSLRTLTVNQNRATIGFIPMTHPATMRRKRGPLTVGAVVSINNRRSRQFGWSPRNRAFIAREVQKLKMVKVRRVA